MSMQASREARLRPALANAALVLVSLVVSGILLFAAGEVFFRMTLGGAVAESTAENWFEFDEQRGWRLRPGEYTKFSFGSNRAVDVSINEWGLRDRVLGAEVPPGKQRVSIVGDSFVFSEALNAPRRFTERLQDLAGAAYEIVNISVPGYGTGQEFRMLESLMSQGFQIGSKLILVFFTNDIQDNLGVRYSTLAADPLKPRFAVDATGNLQSVNPTKTKKGRGGKDFWRRSLFFNFLKHRVEMAATRFPAIYVALDTLGLAPAVPRTPGIVAGWYGAGWEDRWSVTRDILRYFANYVRTRLPGVDLHIAFIPSPLQVEDVFQVMISRNLDEDARYAEFLDDLDRPQRMLHAFTEEQGISLIDTTPALRAASGAYFPSEGHLSELGSDLVARVLYKDALGGK